MQRKKKVVQSAVTIDDIDVTALPFQSRTTLGQYVLKALDERRKREPEMRDSCACSITLTMPELMRGNKIVV